MAVKKGDKVKLDYTGAFESGLVFDSTKDKEPFEFEAGAGMVIKGFDDAVIGMEKGQEKMVSIKPEDGYGQKNSELVKKLPRSKLPKGEEPKPEMKIILGTSRGQKIPAKITEVNDKEITIDLNHPLAGRTLKFRIKVVDIDSKAK